MLLIPSIDLRAGHCVRLTQGDFAAVTRYAAHPRMILRRYRSLGARWVHMVDLDGARDGQRINHPVIAALAASGIARLQVGGGVRSAADIEALLGAGVARVVVGSAALDRPHEVAGWLERFGRERLCLAFDVRAAAGAEPRVCTAAWRTQSSVSLWDALRCYAAGTFRHVLCTDVAQDGTLAGPNLELYRAALARFPSLLWQASGGIRSAQDLEALARVGVSAAVSGRALIEERVAPEELRPYLPDASFRASTFEPARS
jgi:phosphoribosylformimino-5-aminoimidazole carboxamide ribotide isomerase